LAFYEAKSKILLNSLFTQQDYIDINNHNMKNIILSLSLLLTISFLSCNNRAEKESALKNLEQSQNKLREFQQGIVQLTENLRNNKTELGVAKDRVEQAKVPQFLRTPEEREQAIRKATKEVQNLETSTDEMNHEVLALKDSVTQTEVNINRLKEFLKK
jgi:chromosome segregation ATPase